MASSNHTLRNLMMPIEILNQESAAQVSPQTSLLAIFDERARHSITDGNGIFPFQLSSNKLPRESGVEPLIVPEPLTPHPVHGPCAVPAAPTRAARNKPNDYARARIIFVSFPGRFANIARCGFK